ncbi:MAG: hypothetical protein C0473_04215 [Cyanobacteria bacterium DS3.002]|nr:hypothetical protein [Cyanobacteria bacterium DS3.002]
MAKFEWDENKREKTLRERGLDFADAHLALNDDFAFTCPDPKNEFDDRWILIGRLNEKTVVVLVYKEPKPDTFRIISMREANRQEITRYEAEKGKQVPTQDDNLTKLLEQLTRDRELREELDSIKQDALKRRQENT